MKESDSVESKRRESNPVLESSEQRFIRDPAETVPLVACGETHLCFEKIIKGGLKLPIGRSEPASLQCGPIDHSSGICRQLFKVMDLARAAARLCGLHRSLISCSECCHLLRELGHPDVRE